MSDNITSEERFWIISGMPKPEKLNPTFVWHSIFSVYERMILQGCPAKKLRRQVAQTVHEVFHLAPNYATARKKFRYQYRKWVMGGRTPKAMKDQRPIKSGRPRKSIPREEWANKIAKRLAGKEPKI